MTREQRLVLAIAVLASFVAFLDGSVINVALPAMSEELGGGLSTQQWIVDAYLITLGSLILLAGSLSDVFGRIVVLRAGLIGFGVASLAIAVAPSVELVIVLRGVQGIAGALLVPSSLAIILSAFRNGAQARAIGSWTAWTSAAFLAGPFLGGVFVQFLNWRLVFAINVLPIAVTLWLLFILRQRDERKPDARVDIPGAILGIVGLGGPVFALIEQQNFGWGSPVILLPMIIGVLSLIAFVWWQSKAKAPMLPLGLFRIRNFSVGNVSTAFVYSALSISGFIVVIFLQQVAGFTPTLAALAFIPVSIANVALSRFFGGLSARFGPRIFMTVGPILAGIGHLLFLSMGESVNYFTDVLPGVLVFSLGISMTVAPLTAAILGDVPSSEAGIGSAVNNAVARVAGLIGIAMIGVVIMGQLDVPSFHRVLIVTAALLFAGGLISLAGIRNPAHVTQV
ncbi:EmrB/QacA subfamily drug resistance transporter [Leifsonia sp. AK011]|uniref:MFS transporter n=1 Tax=Leifsonia sp. AK011 TaxID=2723075 RepID=UPI0015C85B9C|nr:MFS transporter [Leifsonia sp. AK011]NYF10992.1 EmrB/QacA subfamily drug resistance transporter [Leifsonia sp. AK011]